MPAALPDPHVIFQPFAAAHVALAVSGGSDSMALLRLAANAGLHRLTVLTVDHGLRAQAAAEARQVRDWCVALALAHHILVWTGVKPASGLQARARQARYDLMNDWCLANGATVLMTAHTLDDQAETVLMRLARTSSLDSLAGIPKVGQWQGLQVFRPLLGERRETLRQYLRALGQEWIEDPSNDDPRFERVRIRKVMPLLSDIGITVEALGGLAQEARNASHALWSAAQDWVKAHVKEFETGHCLLDCGAYDGQGGGLRSRSLGLLIRHFGGGRTPEPAELGLLVEWLSLKRQGRRTLGGAIIVRRKRNILIGREPGRIDTAAAIVPEGGRLVWDGRFEIIAPPGSQVIPAVAAERQPRRKDLPAFVQEGLPVLLEPGKAALKWYHQADGVPWARFRQLNSA